MANWLAARRGKRLDKTSQFGRRDARPSCLMGAGKGADRPQPRRGGASRVNWRCLEPRLCANRAGHAIGPAQFFLAWRGSLPRWSTPPGGPRRFFCLGEPRYSFARPRRAGSSAPLPRVRLLWPPGNRRGPREPKRALDPRRWFVYLESGSARKRGASARYGCVGTHGNPITAAPISSAGRNRKAESRHVGRRPTATGQGGGRRAQGDSRSGGGRG